MDKKNDTPNKFDEAVKTIADADIKAPAGFTQKVMAHLEDQDEATTFSWRYIMEIANRKFMRTSALGGLCMVALLCLVIARGKDMKTITTDQLYVPGQEQQRIVEKLTDPSSSAKQAQEAYSLYDKSLSETRKDIQNKNKTLEAELSSMKSQREQDQRKVAEIMKKLIQKVESNESGSMAQGTAPKAPPVPASDALTTYGNVDDYIDGTPLAFAIGRGLPAEPNEWSQTVRRRLSERYSSYIENAPVSVTKEPVSTFSIDVDTGSYTNARRFLKNGNLPPKDAVRIEEFINYFSYDYPSQSEKPFGLTYEIAPNPLDNGKYLLRLGIKAKEIQDERKPWNLVFLVDVSGSMNTPDKLPLLKESLTFLTKNLKSSDRISLVTYSGNSQTVLESTPASEKEKIMQAIASLSAGGSTNGESGIQMAYAEAKKGFIDNGVNRVILATDGDFNVGVTGNDQLIKIIEEKRKEHITLTTIGFGTGNYNEAMMEQVANKGNGNYFYIDNFREARKVFGKDLAGTIEVVAKDVKLQIEFNPEHVAQYRLIGYENRKLENHEFNDDKIDAGEIGSGHTVTALYEIVLTGSEEAKKLSIEHRYERNKKQEEAPVKASNSSELAFLKIRYKQPEGDKSTLLTFPLETSSVKAAGEESADFKFVSAVSGFASKLRQSNYAPEASVEKLIELANAGRGNDTDGNRSEFIHLMENVSARLK